MPPSIGSRLRAAALLGPVLALCLGPRAGAQTINLLPYDFTTIAGTAQTAGSSNGTGASALFNLPRAVAVDTAGNIYVADTQNQTVREIGPGNAVTTLAGTAGTIGGANGTGTGATFSALSGIAVDTAGNVYVADSGNYDIRKITPTVVGGVTSYVVTTLAGSYPGGYVNGAGGVAKFGQISGLAIDAAGNLYTCDLTNQAIRAITPAGQVSTVAGTQGVAGHADGPGASASFNQPYGIAADSVGNLYVADSGNNLIRAITPAGQVSTLAGTALVSGYGDGTGTAAQFSSPRGVAVDSTGTVYVADTNNSGIRSVSPGGVTHTLAGFGAGSSDGIGYGARFRTPYGIAVGGSGTVYVADTNNDTIRSGFLAIAPVFTLLASPATATVASGRTAVFNAIATGSPAPTYQWTLNGSPTIPGASVTIDPILMVTGATSGSAGTYTCTATNVAGSVTTSATLSVVTSSNPGYLNNVSALGYVGTGAGILIGGFNIVGSGGKEILVRGIGPGLNTMFQLNGYVLDPYAELFSGNSPVMMGGSPVQNDDWGTPDYPGAPLQAAVSTAMATLGAYSLPSQSKDAVLLFTLPNSGGYTVQVSGVGGATGTGVVEIYDADSGAPATRLNNLSARDLVETGQNILIGGFNIAGVTDETVLIRAIGPGLNSQFGLTGILAQPVLTLYKGSTAIYSNTVWGADPVLTAAQSIVGAYALVPTSTDSLLLVTLHPAGYTAQVTGLNGTTGIAVVEIYEVQ